MFTRARIATALLGIVGATVVLAQDRIKDLPGYDQFTKMQPQIGGSITPGSLGVTWAADAKSFTYNFGGKAYKYDPATREATVTGDAPEPPANAGGRGGQGQQPPAQAARGGRGGLEQVQSEMAATPVEGCPTGSTARGRQAFCVESPDHKLKAFYRTRNLWIANLDGSNEKAISTDGSEKGRIKYGTGSWVYGEELAQTTAIWWSPDSSKVGYYRFDESQVKDFFLQMNQTAVQDAMDVEAYPKPGAPNPIADILIYDVAAGKSVKLDIRNGKPFSDDVVGHYAYDVRWSPDGAELFLNRTNRRQQILQFVACSPASGACRVIVQEEWPTGWTNNRPAMQYLKDNRRFIWESERNGWRNFYLYDLTGKQLATLSNHTTFEAANIVKVDESAGVMFYTARDGDNFMKLQLHRVGLDGKGDVRLTDPKFNHAIAPCGQGAGAGRGGRGGGPGGPGGPRRRLRHLLRQSVPRRCLPDSRPAASHPAPGRLRQGRGATRQGRYVQVRSARPPQGRDVHLQSRRRNHPSLRHHRLPV